MAVTRIWAISSPAARVINYAVNPEKTTEGSAKTMADLHCIENVVQYAANEMKTEKREYVSCRNCTSVETAAKEFQEVKKLWGKLDGRQCFHAYQSFRPGEVDAATAHEIGVKLAEKVWGDRFQVVIATHCNTGCFHNHYVVNAVSWLDGTHFDCWEEDYQYMREVSDWLCKKYRLSVIEDPKRRKKNHGEYLAEKNGKPTYSKLIRQDIDNAILATDTRTAFFSYLESMGYQLRLYKKNGDLREQPSLRPPGAERFFRFQTLGDRYDLESIEQRIWKKITKAEPFPEADEEIVMQQRAKYQPPYRRKETGLSGLYVRYRFEIGIIQRYPASVKQVSQFLREDIVKLDRLDAETQLLSKANISTIEELTAYQANLNLQIQALTEKRKDLRNEQRHCYRQREPGNMEECRQQVADLTKQIAKLKKEVSLCDDIALRSARTREELEWIIDHQEQTRKENNGHELFRGRSRTDR